MKVFDDYLQMEVDVQDVITPEVERNIEINDPEEFKQIFEEAEQ